MGVPFVRGENKRPVDQFKENIIGDVYKGILPKIEQNHNTLIKQIQNQTKRMDIINQNNQYLVEMNKDLRNLITSSGDNFISDEQLLKEAERIKETLISLKQVEKSETDEDIYKIIDEFMDISHDEMKSNEQLELAKKIIPRMREVYETQLRLMNRMQNYIERITDNYTKIRDAEEVIKVRSESMEKKLLDDLKPSIDKMVQANLVKPLNKVEGITEKLTAIVYSGDIKPSVDTIDDAEDGDENDIEEAKKSIQ